METADVFKFLQEQIHTTVIATNDQNGNPVTCAVDIMDYDEKKLYFLTAKGKNFYERLIDKKYIAVTGLKGSDTMHSISVSVRGNVREIGMQRLKRLFQKNEYMYEIYPDEKSREALTVFQIYSGNGELFDLSKKPIERYSFSFGNAENTESGYYVTDKCKLCRECLAVCPQKCIDTEEKTVRINQTNCLHCGNCLEICRFGAVEKRG